MRIAVGITLINLFACAVGCAQQAVSNSVETHRFTSKVFSNTRTIRVLLPPDYYVSGNSKERYPVLYLNDGIMVFHAFKIEETVHQLINAKVIPPLVIVGIDNGGSTDKTTNPIVDRANEFLPYPDAGFAPDNLYEPKPPNPVGKEYPAFIAEVMKFIEQKYRIKSGAENTAAGGFSYGGVAALYVSMKMPNAFGKVLLESIPLWIGRNKELLKDAQQVRKWADSIYVGLGTNESPLEAVRNEGKADQDALIQAIKTNSPNTRLKVVLEEGGKHQPAAWARRFPAALKFLFADQRMPQP